MRPLGRLVDSKADTVPVIGDSCNADDLNRKGGSSGGVLDGQAFSRNWFARAAQGCDPCSCSCLFPFPFLFLCVLLPSPMIKLS